MPKTEAFVAGRQITVDNSQFDVKFTKTVKQLESGLSRAQKALGLYYDKNQQLNDALGRCVEGLSMWQVKLGMWVDETGRARTITGGFSEGLSKTDLELGRFIDNMGKVRSRTGDYVRDSEALIRAEKEKVDALHQTREAFADAFDAVGDGAGRFASLLTQFDGLDGRLDSLADLFVKVSGTIDLTTQTFNAFQNAFVGLQKSKQMVDSLQASLATSTTTAQGLKAAIAAMGGPWTLIAAGIASAVSALALFKDSTDDASKKSVEANEKISESFEKVKQRAKEAGDTIRSVDDVLRHGAFFQENDNSLNALEPQIDALNKKIASLETERAKELERAKQQAASAGMSGGSWAAQHAYDQVKELTKQLTASRKELEPLQAQYNEIAEELVRKVREEQTTEEQKAEALKAQYRALLEHCKTDEDRAAIAAKIKSIDDGIAESKAKELAEQEKALADQRAKLEKDLGISLDFTPVKTQEEALEDDIAKLRETFSEQPEIFGGVISGLEEAEKRIRQKYSDESLSSFSDALGKVDSTESLAALQEDLADKLEKGMITQEAYDSATQDAIAKEKELTEARIAAIPGLRELLDESEVDQEQLSEAEKEYASTMDALTQALEERLLDDEKHAELVRKADAKLAKAKDDEAKRLSDEARSKLGIDAIMEELKTPAQKFADKMQEALAALDANQISAEEFDAYREKLQDDLFAQKEDLGKFAKKFEEPKTEKSDKAQPAKSMEAGSADLYLAQVRNSTAQYQRQIQSTTEQMFSTQLDALDESRMTNYYLQEMIANRSSLDLPVWG